MIIQTLKLVNFRSHKTKTVEFADGVNLIVGANGAGKTNILEAVYLLSTGKSFRAKLEVEMIYNPQIAKTNNQVQVDFAKVTGTITDGSGSDVLDVVVTKGAVNPNLCRKTFKINGTPKRISELETFLPCVLFTPYDLDLFTGSPALRRRFLDDLLCVVDKKYKKEHNTYTKALRQRNKVLEKICKLGAGREELPFWTEQILTSGCYIQEERVKLLETLNQTAQEVYKNISSSRAKTHIEYKINQINSARLEKHKEHEILAKTTLVGPHRDDFEFMVNGFNLALYGSRGQQRTGILSLKISELEIMSATLNETPILLLDDIFSELDDEHKRALSRIVSNQQTIITSVYKEVCGELSASNTIMLNE